jgi:acetolactate synthase-1/3 small subunit
MCIVLKGQDGVIEQARRQLEDLVYPFLSHSSFHAEPRTFKVPVWAVLDYTKTPTIERELLLAKVSILGPEFAHHHNQSNSPIHSDSSSLNQEITQQNLTSPPPFLHGNSNTPPPAEDEKIAREQALARTFEGGGEENGTLYPGRSTEGNGMTASEALIAKNLHMGAIKVLVEQFGGKVVDVAENSVIVEVTAKGSRIDAFLSLMRPFGVLEAARSGEWRWIIAPGIAPGTWGADFVLGVMVLPRTPIPKYGGEEEVMTESGPVDLSLLPPG